MLLLVLTESDSTCALPRAPLVRTYLRYSLKVMGGWPYTAGDSGPTSWGAGTMGRSPQGLQKKAMVRRSSAELARARCSTLLYAPLLKIYSICIMHIISSTVTIGSTIYIGLINNN